MRDPRPDIPAWGQGLLAAVGFTAAAIYVAGFYWWTLLVTLSLGTGVFLVSRRERKQRG